MTSFLYSMYFSGIKNHHAAIPSQMVAPNNCDDAAEALSTLDVAAPSSAKNLIPTVSSAA